MTGEIAKGLKNVPLANLIEYSCQFLPEGWSIVIYSENGSASITVKNPDGETIDIDNYDKWDLSRWYAEAIEYCLEIDSSNKKRQERNKR